MPPETSSLGQSTSVADAPSSLESCPVCGAALNTVIHAGARDPITLDRFRVVECSACGVAYTAPRPASLDRYYPQRYRGYGPTVKRILGSLYNARVARWSRMKSEGGSVLEIGCGPGLMLAAFRRRGWNVLGIERDETMAEKARRETGLDILAQPIETLPADARFDLIIMFHVLEHIGEPVGLLAECRKRLAPGGRLIINVPNFSSWQSKWAGSRWLHLDVPRHLVHFTPETLGATLERAGLTLLQVSFASLEHDPYGWIESAVSRATGHANTLTRFLMGLDPAGPRVVFSFVFGALVLPAALLVSGISWLARSGALMEATAVIAEEQGHIR